MRLIRSSILLLFIVLITIEPLISQAYNEPESVVYDATNDRYLVSNKGNGDIISVPRTNTNNLSFFYTGVYCASLRGITIVGNTLWGAGTSSQATQNQYLFSFNIATGELIKSVGIASGVFLNDVSADASGMIYVSDDNNNKIYKVNPETGGFTDLNFDGANGLLFDGVNNRLLYTDDTPATGSQISALDIASNTSAPLIANPNFQYLDGLTVDHLGNYYVSSWSTNEVYRYDPNFTAFIVASTGHNGVLHSGPADIFYDQVNNILAVPNFTANTVDFIPFTQLSTYDSEISIPNEFQLHQNYPNPFNPSTTINYDITEELFVNVAIYNLLGAEVVQLVNKVEQPGIKTISWDGRDFDGNQVKGGVYVYRIIAGNYSETKKMVLLK